MKSTSVNVEESNWVQAKREKSGRILQKTAQKKLNQGFGNTFAFSISNRYDALLEEDFSNTKKYKPKKSRNVSDSTISKSSNDDSETLATDCAGNNHHCLISVIKRRETAVRNRFKKTLSKKSTPPKQQPPYFRRVRRYYIQMNETNSRYK